MVGIPMDRVGAGMVECGWYCTAIHPRVVVLAGGVAFRGWCGVYFSRLLSPTSQLLTRAVGVVRCAHCLFFGGSVFPTVSGNWATL